MKMIRFLKKRITHPIWTAYTLLGSAVLVYALLVFYFPSADSILYPSMGFLLSRDEIGRAASPDSTLDAVTIRSNAGAMPSIFSKPGAIKYGYQVYVVPAGGKPRIGFNGDEVLRAKNVHDMEVKWKEPRVLEIHYEQAAILNFRNCWFRQDSSLRVDKIYRDVKICLIPHSESFSQLRR